MKKRIVTVFVALLMLIPGVITVFAKSYDLSSGLSIIVSKSTLKKCSMVDATVTFSPTDFDNVLGVGDYVTFTTLPDKENGRLLIGSTPIKKGQTISRKSTKYLVFEPSEKKALTATFSFSDTPDGTRRGICTVFVLENENFAPKTEEFSFETSKNISYKSFLAATDPENDKFEFVISASPKHGTLILNDASTGLFTYTPKVDFTGRDTFKFKARDIYGNESETVRVVLHVNENDSDTVFSDMTNHWAHESAILVFDDNVLRASFDESGLVFCPDEKITRGDFLAVAMIGAGLEEQVEKCFFTSFSDDAKIPMNIKSYAETARKLGIIKGVTAKDGVNFESERFLTRKEAEIIISRILSTLNSGESDSADAYEAQILVGVGNGERLDNSIVTKAQLARIYCNLKNYTSPAS